MALLPPVVLSLVLAAPAVLAEPVDRIDQARVLLSAYIARSQAFDPRLADLYSDEALIENLRVYRSGEVRRLTIPAAHYKALMRESMTLARARGDTNRFSQPRFALEGSNVRITLTRYSELKNYASPLVLVVGPRGDGTWAILEERSESRP